MAIALDTYLTVLTDRRNDTDAGALLQNIERPSSAQAKPSWLS